MIRLLVAALLACLPIGQASAQFQGYPPLNYFNVGQGAAGVPQWLAPPAARTSMGLGTMATQNANAVAITGGTITGLPLPNLPPDAVNKQYVDQNSTGLTVHASVNLATTTALPVNAYNNGAAGVGATLTASCASSCAAPTIDGNAATLGMRIIVKNEAATANNGIYNVTTVGTGSTPYVLTRSADANTPGTLNFNAIGAGTYALVTAGTANANTGWVVQSQVAAIGISPIVWSQFSASSGVSSIGGLQGAFTCGSGISCAGNALNTVMLPLPQGRLTLTPNTPVMTVTAANQNTIRYDCYHGGRYVPVYNGSISIILPIGSCEITDVLPPSGTGVVNTAGVFDEWAVNIAGTLTLCHATNGAGGGWASDSGSNTARGTGYSQRDETGAVTPFFSNTNIIANCYNGAANLGPIAANQATHLGIYYTTAAGQTGMVFGADGAPPTAACFCLGNTYNRVFATTTIGETTTTWNYSVINVWRQARGDTTFVVRYVDALAEDNITASYNSQSSGSGTPRCYVGVGVNSTTAFSGTTSFNSLGSSQLVIGAYKGVPGVGSHVLTPIELSDAGAACTFVGNVGAATRARMGITVELRM